MNAAKTEEELGRTVRYLEDDNNIAARASYQLALDKLSDARALIGSNTEKQDTYSDLVQTAVDIGINVIEFGQERLDDEVATLTTMKDLYLDSIERQYGPDGASSASKKEHRKLGSKIARFASLPEKDARLREHILSEFAFIASDPRLNDAEYVQQKIEGIETSTEGLEQLQHDAFFMGRDAVEACYALKDEREAMDREISAQLDADIAETVRRSLATLERGRELHRAFEASYDA
ncbi:hypothetical protein CMO88_00270 [Candidatus Woesearchaeota archaeon]|nr:hypothetical protein [Candidatus Woesearchaeota archaeon]